MEPWIESSITGLSFLVMVVGLFGLVVPLFPGMLVMWLGALGYGWVTGFDALGVVMLVLITLLAIFGAVVDNLMMGVGARRGGASWWSILAAFVAGVIGTLIFPPLGGLIAAPLAVLLLEYRRLQDWDQVWGAVRGLATGWGLSFVVRFLVGLLMLTVWGFWVLLRT